MVVKLPDYGEVLHCAGELVGIKRAVAAALATVTERRIALVKPT
jgi:hypothetical protein